MIPFVSVIIPNYNHARFLPRRLESVLNQNFTNFELILLDDCSTDESWQYLKKFENHPKVSHCIRNDFNSGSPFKQWKKGIDLAQSELIWIAESDDCCEAIFLEEMVSRLDKNSSLIYCGTDHIDEIGNQISGKFPNWNFKDKTDHLKWMIDHSADGRSEILNYLSFRNTIVNASSVVFRKPSFFPSEVLSMRYCGDWYFWIYILQTGNVNFCSLKLNYFRIHEKPFQVVKSNNQEYVRLKEIFKCIKYSRKVLQLKLPRRIDYLNYSDLVKYYVWNLKELKLPLIIFKEFPYFLIPFFLYQYIKHKLKKILSQ